MKENKELVANRLLLKGWLKVFKQKGNDKRSHLGQSGRKKEQRP